MRVYTRRGDDGQTELRGESRVSKTNPRIEAYGTVDETNALLGHTVPTGHDDVDAHLETIQNHLHIVQAELATPDEDADSPEITAEHTELLEGWIDTADEELDPLAHFIVPGGGDAGSQLHYARSVCRRAERRVVAIPDDEYVNETVLSYLNRLSDALFTFARLVNSREGEPESEPTY